MKTLRVNVTVSAGTEEAPPERYQIHWAVVE
jgi:hypothetical protein